MDLCKFGYIFLFLLVSNSITGQNVLNERAFWSTNPSISQIEAKIQEGHDATALNANAFDAVTWSLIEKTNNQSVKYLLSLSGNDVNKLTHDGRTYLFWAAYKANLEIMQYLLVRGAKTDIIDDHGNTVANFAASSGQMDTKVYDLLIAHGSSLAQEKNQEGANALLLVGPHLNDLNFVDYLVSKGFDINTKDNDGNGLFNYAARKGNIDLLKQLVARGLSHRGRNKLNGNAMLFAARGARRHTNSLEVFKYLQSLRIPGNITNTNGINPLHYLAYSCKDPEVYQFFINKNVYINKVDNDGNTPLLNASRSNNLEIIKMLTTKRTNVNHVNNLGQSALMKATERNSLDVMEFLLEKGAKMDLMDKKGYNLTYYLFNTFNAKKRKTFDEKLNLLEANGFKLDTDQGNGATLLHLAVDKNNIDHVLYALKYDVDINKKNNDGLTALHVAAMKAKNTEILKVLIRNGADLSIRTDFEESAFDLASENELLIENNADIAFLRNE
ncbi:MAG: ankyrin repeat domain-containing protein [bacterium]